MTIHQASFEIAMEDTAVLPNAALLRNQQYPQSIVLFGKRRRQRTHVSVLVPSNQSLLATDPTGSIHPLS